MHICWVADTTAGDLTRRNFPQLLKVQCEHNVYGTCIICVIAAHIQLFRERLSEKSVNVHATILKGSLGHDKYSFH